MNMSNRLQIAIAQEYLAESKGFLISKDSFVCNTKFHGKNTRYAGRLTLLLFSISYCITTRQVFY